MVLHWNFFIVVMIGSKRRCRASALIGQHEYHEPGYISVDSNKIKFGLLGNIEKEIFHNLVQFAPLSILSYVVVQAGNMV